MKGIILAAGEGTRLRPKTERVPKPLIEIRGIPILSYCFETLLELGIEEAVVVVGYKKDMIIDRYGYSYRGLDVKYAIQHERDGLAHAVLAAWEYVESDCVLINGDNIYQGNLTTALHRHRTTDSDITFLCDVVSPEEASQGAVCELDENRTVTGLVEKPDSPPSLCVPAAFYILPPEIFPACRIVRMSDRGEFELADAIDILIYSGYDVETVPFDGWKVNVNTERDIERAEELLKDKW